MAIILSVAEETNASSADDNKACSNRRSREDKYSNGKRTGTEDGSAFQKRSLCYESG